MKLNRFLLYFFCLSIIFSTGQSNTEDSNKKSVVFLSGAIVSFLGMTVPEIYNNIDSQVDRNICFAFFALSYLACMYKFFENTGNSGEMAP